MWISQRLITACYCQYHHELNSQVKVEYSLCPKKHCHSSPFLWSWRHLSGTTPFHSLTKQHTVSTHKQSLKIPSKPLLPESHLDRIFRWAGNSLRAVWWSLLLALQEPARVHEATDLSLCAELLQLTGHSLNVQQNTCSASAEPRKTINTLAWELRFSSEVSKPRHMPANSSDGRL